MAADMAPTPAAGMPLPPLSFAPPQAAAPATPPTTYPPDQYAATAALNVVEQTSPTGYEANPWDMGATGQYPAPLVETGRGITSEISLIQPFRITPLVAVATLAGVLGVATSFVTISSFEVTGDIVNKQRYKLNDFSSNLTLGVIVAAVVLIGGAALGATGRRVGAGLAGGAGLALAGAFAWVIGQVTLQFDMQEVLLLDGGGTFTLTTTQEIGFVLAAVAAGLGVVAFLLSLTSGGADGQPAFNPAIGMIGALGTLAVVVGPLIPMNGAAFGDNFSNDFIPPATLYLRLAILVLIGIGGLVGFLANRRWGSGLALGAICVGAIQWFTAIAESGDYPLGIAGGNVGASDYAPHIVTTIGVIVMLLAGAGGLLAAAQQRNAR
ncbi:MAG TPA: hypothetical protein PLP26_06535 [Ilumatobacteraceae bacterium]|nr:hypothetical protein [Ilumatobacteraceae bacterium]